MVYSNSGKFGIVSNLESASCRTAEAVMGSNPPPLRQINNLRPKFQPLRIWSHVPKTAFCCCFKRSIGPRGGLFILAGHQLDIGFSSKCQARMGLAGADYLEIDPAG